MKFAEFGLHDDILEAISFMGFDEATPVQEQTIPVIISGKDLIACAQTGTGKTAAFVLPVLQFISEAGHKGTNTLVIVPTRELAIQIDQQVQGLSYMLNVSSIAIYGGGDGDDWGQQKIALTQGADIVIATPGKLLSHLNLGYVDFTQVKHLILDEADRMLDIGFHDDIMKIISFLPKIRQTLMFSATMPPKIRDFARKILDKPVEINLAMSKPAEGVLQAAYLVHENQKTGLINSLLANKPEYASILIFSSTKKKVVEIVRSLKKNHFSVEGISSDLEQSEREEVLLRFRAKNTRILVATDVMSRGIDIKDINLIINYDVPHDAEDYVHRVGRTARADATGVALTFINLDDMQRFQRIERLIETEVLKMPPPVELGEGPVWTVNTRSHQPSGKGKNRSTGGKSSGRKPFYKKQNNDRRRVD